MMEEGRDTEASVSRGELVPVGQPESMEEWAELLVARAREEGVALTGEGGLLTGLMRQVLQTGLEVEMAEHLGYGPHERGRSRVGQLPQRRLRQDGCDRDRRGRPARPARSARQLRAGDGAQVPASPGWAFGQRDLALREGVDDRRHPAASARDLRDGGLAGDDLEDHRPDRRRHDRLAEPAAGSALRGPVDRLPGDQGPRLAGRKPARLRGDRR